MVGLRARHVGIGPRVFVRRSMAFGGKGEGGRGAVIMPTCSFDSTLRHASAGSLHGLLCKCSSQNFSLPQKCHAYHGFAGGAWLERAIRQLVQCHVVKIRSCRM